MTFGSTGPPPADPPPTTGSSGAMAAGRPPRPPNTFGMARRRPASGGAGSGTALRTDASARALAPSCPSSSSTPAASGSSGSACQNRPQLRTRGCVGSAAAALMQLGLGRQRRTEGDVLRDGHSEEQRLLRYHPDVTVQPARLDRRQRVSAEIERAAAHKVTLRSARCITRHSCIASTVVEANREGSARFAWSGRKTA